MDDETRPGSALGIDYSALVGNQMADLLLQGEQEWLANAPAEYGADAGEVWAGDVLHELLAGALSDASLEDLERFAPRMMARLFGLK